MNNQYYDGSRTVVHAVKHGESLSLIAKNYRFSKWEPIWIYNTKVQKVLGPDPSRIKTGTKILIPRGRQGYETLLRKLRSLKSQIAAQGDKLKYELEGEHYKHKATRVLFDLAGDVATLIGTVCLKAANAARAAKTASSATGNAKVAAQYLADKKAEQLSKSLTSALKDKSVNAVLTTIDKDAGQAHKDLYLTQKKGVNAIRNVSLQGGRSFLDIADILMDYVTVSNVADGMISVMVGETPGETYDKAQQNIRNTVQRSQAQLDQKIQHYQRERMIVYG